MPYCSSYLHSEKTTESSRHDIVTKSGLRLLIFQETKTRMRTFVSWAALGLVAATARTEPAEIPKEEKTPPLAAWLSADGITGDWGGLRSKLA